jgi:CRP-like cAMP-binding protein
MHGTFEPSRRPRRRDTESAVYLTEVLSELNKGAGFLDRLNLREIDAVRRASIAIVAEAGEAIFMQGDRHDGIYLIESGRVRTYYAGPSGKEITLALWTPGHFVGGPEVFGGGVHVWSAVAMAPSRLAYLPGGRIRQLVDTFPAFAVSLIEGLVAKGKCYSAMVQMLGTRSATERLAHLLLILAEVDGKASGGRLIVNRRITHEQLAGIVGSTRQWVTSTLARYQQQGVISMERGNLVIERAHDLRGR